MSYAPYFLCIAALFAAAGALNLYSASRRPGRPGVRRWLASSCFAWGLAAGAMATGGTPAVAVFAAIALVCMCAAVVAAARRPPSTAGRR
ncbi:MAG TPA: hypothetical protein VLH79_02805 [Chthonomonadales bacterium]|nr:hypothetical protein [Chthonomonadales bacterium]